MFILPTNHHQEALTQKWIHSNEQVLKKDLLQLRLLLDDELDELNQENITDFKTEHFDLIKFKKLRNSSQWNNYPIGACRPITLVIQQFIESDHQSPPLKGVDILRAFIKEGGIVHHIWGEVRGECFQNSLQLGTAYLDVANDTVDIRKEKIVLAPLNDCEFSNVESYLQFGKIADSYWDCHVLINDCFPNLFPYYNLFLRPDESSLKLNHKIEVSESLFRYGSRTVTSLFGNDGLEFSPVSEHYGSILKEISQQLKGNSEIEGYLKFQVMGPQQLLEKAQTLDQFATSERRENHDLRLKAVKFLNTVLHHKNI